jgi:hypothetical protein
MSDLRRVLSAFSQLIAADHPWLGPSRKPLRTARSDAERRSLRLLLDALSPIQRAQYQTETYFDVTGGQTGRRYRIRSGRQMNVEELDAQGRRVWFLCFVPRDHLPTGDILLAQKFALELFEMDALSVAVRAPAWSAIIGTGVL